MGAGDQMTAAEIRALQKWIANNREHLCGHAGKISRALDIARETIERAEAAAVPLGPGHHGGPVK